MFVVYGSKAKHLGSKELPNAECPECHEKGLILSVFQKYFHIFWIPFIGYKKTGQSTCPHCKHSEEKKNFSPSLQEEYSHLNSEYRTPPYMFSGLVLVSLLIAFVSYSNSQDKKAMASYAAEPQVGDLHIIKDESQPEYPYSLYKLIEVTEDSIYFVYSDMVYNQTRGFTEDIDKGKLQDTSYFVNDFYFATSIADVVSQLEGNEIREIIRE